MQYLDLLVLLLYAVGMLAIGRIYKQQITTRDDYLLGGRGMSPWMIGVSLFATLTSTLSYLAYPGEMIQHGPMIFTQLTSVPLVVWVVGWILIPRIMAQDVTSGYELLEQKLGMEGRLLGAGMFMLLRTLWMASILYATTNKVLIPLLNLNPAWGPVISLAMGIVTLIYSSEGGMRAVVMTDALQSAIMLLGAIVVLGVVTATLGGVNAWWPQQWVPAWQTPVFWFSSNERITWMGACLNYFVWLTCTFGSDQMAIQRYLSTRDIPAARRSLIVSIATEVILSLLLGLVGLAILGYYLAHPHELAAGRTLYEQSDELFPKFVANVLPAGLSGLVIAAILSAAMSSLSSGMNSASAVITTDFLPHWRGPHRGVHDPVRTARVASIAVGLLAVLISMFIGHFVSNLLELCMKVVNLLTAPIFVLFFLAMFVPWSRPRGAIAATVVSVTVAVAVAFGWMGQLEFLWASPLSFASGAIVGTLVSALSAHRRPSHGSRTAPRPR